MGSPPPPDFSALIARLAERLRARRLPFMLIGGQAVLLHGRPRLTEDIDVTLGTGPDGWKAVREICDELGLAPLPDDVESFVRETFVLPARDPATGIRVDFIFSTTPYEHQAIARAVQVELGGVTVPFAAAEDARATSRTRPAWCVARGGISTGNTSSGGRGSLRRCPGVRACRRHSGDFTRSIEAKARRGTPSVC